MEWDVIVRCAIILVILAAAGGLVWYMELYINKKGKYYKLAVEKKTDSKSTFLNHTEKGMQDALREERQKAVDPSKAKQKQMPRSPDTVSTKNEHTGHDLPKAKAEAVLSQNKDDLVKLKLPAAEDILKAEAEAKRACGIYNTLRDIKRFYLESMGIRDTLQSICETAERIPEGAREYDEEKEILPLHSFVWNTSANTLKRQTAKLLSKYEELVQLTTAAAPVAPVAPAASQTEELLKPVRDAYDAYKNANGSQDSDRKLDRAVKAYRARKTAADESRENYEAAVPAGKAETIGEFCRELEALMDGDAFGALDKYEVQKGEAVLTDMDGESCELDPTTHAYWEKVKNFAREIQVFFTTWNETIDF